MASLFDIFDESTKADEIATRIAESLNPAKDLVDDLVYWLENDKTEPPRAPGLHCSSLWKTCARTPLLESMHAASIQIRELKAGSRMTFDMGHALHNLIQNIYLGPFGRLYGEWKCLRCQKIVHKGTMPEHCPECNLEWRGSDGNQNIVYSELFVKDEELDFCGHCDGVLMSRDGLKKRVFEFKSKSKAQFARLRVPESSHIIQVHAYMKGLGLEEALILYWDKGSQCDWSRDSDGNWLAGDPHLKSFLVTWNEDLWGAIEQRIKAYHKATSLIKSLPVVTNETVMKFPRVCTLASCDLATDCPVSQQCFALPK